MYEPNGEPVILRKPAAGAEGKEETAVKSTVKRKALLCFLLLLTFPKVSISRQILPRA